MADDFDWSDKECVVVPNQDAIAVYRNPDGDIVIRRQRDWNEEDDSFIIINKRCARNVIEAMERALKIAQLAE